FWFAARPSWFLPIHHRLGLLIKINTVRVIFFDRVERPQQGVHARAGGGGGGEGAGEGGGGFLGGGVGGAQGVVGWGVVEEWLVGVCRRRRMRAWWFHLRGNRLFV